MATIDHSVRLFDHSPVYQYTQIIATYGSVLHNVQYTTVSSYNLSILVQCTSRQITAYIFLPGMASTNILVVYYCLSRRMLAWSLKSAKVKFE